MTYVLREIRKASGRTIEETRIHMDVSVRAVNQWETGQYEITGSKLIKLLKFYNYNPQIVHALEAILPEPWAKTERPKQKI